jgi:hypothetical protein
VATDIPRFLVSTFLSTFVSIDSHYIMPSAGVDVLIGCN